MVGLRPQIALPRLQRKTPALRLCLPGATSPTPRALLLPPLGCCSFALVRWGCASWCVGITIPLPFMGWRVEGGISGTSPNASGYLPLQTDMGEVTSQTPVRTHVVFQAGAAGGCCLHRCARCCPTSRRAGVGPTAPPTGSICGAALAKPVNHKHIKAPAAPALTTPGAGSERTVPVQMFISSFSQLQRTAEFSRKPSEGKEFWLVEGLQQSPRSPCSFTGSSAGVTLPRIPLQTCGGHLLPPNLSSLQTDPTLQGCMGTEESSDMTTSEPNLWSC